MQQELKEFWNRRYAEAGYMYGTEPNAYFKSRIDGLAPGKVLIPGAGEGRDAVYAAAKGWQVFCADISEAGRAKALQLAEEKKANITYTVGDIARASYPDGSFDLIGSVFFHLPSVIRSAFFRGAMQWLKPGGLFVIQSFTPAQLNYSSGGPKDEDMLLNAEKVATELPWLEIEELTESEIMLVEGTHHSGLASVLSAVGRKK